MAKLTLADIDNESLSSASVAVNANSALIEAALENTLSRDGTSPNAMSASIDMGTQRIINLAAPVDPNDAARKTDVQEGADGDDGALWYSAVGTPSSGLGVNSDMYLDSNNGDVYGPKAAGAWPASTLSLIGPAGAGTGDMLKSENLSGLASAASSRTNLGVSIGTHVQAYDAGLLSIAGLTTVADRFIYTTASDTYAVATLTSTARSLLDDANVGAMRTTLGLGTSATTNIGTTTGTAAAGDDSRFTELAVTNLATAYSFALADAGEITRQTGATARAWTIEPNGTVAFPVGSVVTIRNAVAGGIITLTRGSGVSLYIAGETTSKNVAVAAGGLATLIQEATNIWVVSGAGLS